MADTFETFNEGLESPATAGVAVTPSDVTVLSQTSRAIYVGTAGDITVTMADGNDVTFANVPAGTILPIRCTYVKSTGTDASDIVSLS